MSYQIRADYTQQFLLPPSLEDWVSADHPARFIREFVDQLDLSSLGFKVDTPMDGRPYYSSNLLLKAWLYGYFTKIRSARQVERLCKDTLLVIWLMGMHAPDHNTLWRFWHQHRTVIRCLFKQSIAVAMNLGLVGMVVHALDGTKIQAVSSPATMVTKKKLAYYLAAAETAIDEIERAIAEHEGTDEGAYVLPEPLVQQEQLRQQIHDALEELAHLECDTLHLGEPDARVMKHNGHKDLAYNAQAVVDERHGIIVAADVSSGENDAHQLLPMLEVVKDMVGTVAATTVVDAGYATIEHVVEAERKNYNVVVGLTPQSNIPSGEAVQPPYHHSQFHYDATKDVMICPSGSHLTL